MSRQFIRFNVTTQVHGSRVHACSGATECEDETAFTAYDHVAFLHRILLRQVWARGSRLKKDIDQYEDKPTKRALNRSIWDGLQGQLEYESATQTLTFLSEDFQEGLKSFFEKRKAVFRGR